ncbi:radical SAM protein [Desulfurivibrio alkaliphilus]|uniref:Radical SAM domain protein n=1 Tax=Desulfurivibrio alkaliphilus (strain DSM 19089 / UNIQEM U267 / AHT2) TaxID=589865 RepID=D6Z1S5_DESAT|nr:radical SAM protein [Desulfurivibrio alkaliphilus]ADH85500.1 Radical SAM domain protein [Desulfurivibrio alkaliphilus AHT 2]
MDYQGEHLIRPPSEADSIILQVTVGCSHNRCTFCGTYRAEKFRLKDEATIAADLAFVARHCRRQSRIFLADGDVLILPQERLRRLLQDIRQQAPWVKRVRLYANAKAVRHKSVQELKELAELGLDRVYLGLESGHDPTLTAIEKGSTAAQMIDAGQAVRAAGLFLSVTALLGVAGWENSEAHAEATGRVLAAMEPNQVGVLTLMLLPGTPLYQAAGRGDFILPDQAGLLRELRLMVTAMGELRCQLHSNHPSNYLAINARLPRDREAVLNAIDRALAGEVGLRPEALRAL